MDRDALGLVADVGGTNTRLALANSDGVIPGTIVQVANDSADSFEHLAHAYMADKPAARELVVAIAGPVTGRRARLTNRNWVFDADALARDFGMSDVGLINDLEALGHAVPVLKDDSVAPLSPDLVQRGQGQALVVGLGTGFNVAAVDTVSGTVFSCELGHASLPARVSQFLRQAVPDADAFPTVEQLFSGIGLLHLGRALGLEAATAQEIGTSSDPLARRAIDICTDAFGLMVQELAYMYCPRAGFYFNGSLAQVVLAPERRARVLAPLRGDARFGGQMARMPAFLFVSSTVALTGCAAHLQLARQARDIEAPASSVMA